MQVGERYMPTCIWSVASKSIRLEHGSPAGAATAERTQKDS